MGYEISITVKKTVLNLALAMVSGGLVYLASLSPEQQVMGFGIVMALMKMGENYLKHYKD